MIARTDWTLEYINTLDEETMAFVVYWKQKIETEKFNYLGTMLGTHWSKKKINQFFASDGSESGEMDEFILPLALLLDDNLKERLSPKKYVGGEVVGDNAPESLAKMSKEDFFKTIGREHQLKK